MKPRIILNLVLLLLVAGLASFIYFRPKESAQAEFPVLALTASEITQIAIAKPGQPVIELQKRDGGWFVATPFQARGDAAKIDRLLEIVRARGRQRFAADDLGRFELDKPLLTLTLNGEAVRFGTLNPLTGEQYLAAGGSVYLVSPQYFSQAMAQPADFAAKTPLAEGQIPVGFSFPGLSLSLEQGKWTAVPPRPDLGPDALNALAEEWRLASALLSQPYAQGASEGEFSVRLADGKTIPIRILQREPELVLQRVDENMQYHFPMAVGKRLLPPEGS